MDPSALKFMFSTRQLGIMVPNPVVMDEMPQEASSRYRRLNSGWLGSPSLPPGTELEDKKIFRQSLGVDSTWLTISGEVICSRKDRVCKRRARSRPLTSVILFASR